MKRPTKYKATIIIRGDDGDDDSNVEVTLRGMPRDTILSGNTKHPLRAIVAMYESSFEWEEEGEG